jgi:hypothetical protein
MQVVVVVAAVDGAISLLCYYSNKLPKISEPIYALRTYHFISFKTHFPTANEST